jgi:CHAD domain-containing protein
MNRRNTRVTSVLLARRARALKLHMNGALAGNGHGLHQARVASRRLREAVPVLTAGVKGTKANKALKKIRRLTKALGAVRELDVTLHVLDDLAAKDTLPRLALEDVRGHVVNERDERRKVMLKRMEDVDLSKLDRRLSSVGEVLASEASEMWRDALAARLLKRSKTLAAAIADAGHVYGPEQLHRVRLAAKKLRYALELANDARVRGAASGPMRVVKRAQDTLGTLHDLQILQTHVAAVQAQPNDRKRPDGGLEIIGRALEDQCRHLHARYVAMIPKLTEAIALTRSQVVPQLAQRSARSRTRPLKMSLKDRPATRRPAARAIAAGAGQQR